MFQPVHEDVEAGGEPFVTVVEPNLPAERDQGGKAVAGQRPEELVELVSGRRILDPLLVGRGIGVADLEPQGVADDEEERVARQLVGETRGVQRTQECLGQRK